MSFSKTLAGLCFASLFALGCGPDPSQPPQDQARQAARGDGWSSGNYNQLLGGKVGDAWISGLTYTGAQWYLSTLTEPMFASVETISYDGVVLQPGELTTAQGTFQLSGDREELISHSGHTLDFQVNQESLRGVLRMTPHSVDTGGSFTRYTALWIAEGSNPDTATTFCPHSVIGADGTPTAIPEYVIPIGGARWAPDGSRSEEAGAITLGCTHDVVGGCVDWGYGPWGSRVDENGQTQSMVTIHKACTRMKRGDFCGNGSAGTTGQSDFAPMATTIHVKDRVGVHPDTNQTLASMEAFWDEHGASCVNASEYRSNDPTAISKFQIQLSTCPARNVACTAGHTRVFLSARPCTGTDGGGNCIAN